MSTVTKHDWDQTVETVAHFKLNEHGTVSVESMARDFCTEDEGRRALERLVANGIAVHHHHPSLGDLWTLHGYEPDPEDLEPL